MIERPAFRFILAFSLYLLLLVPGWHFYQFIFDLDAVGYASIAEYYAAGNFREAVNGLWSPLHCWLIVPFLKCGISAATAFKITNIFFAIGILYCFHDYLKRTTFKASIQTAALLTAVVILTSYTWFELAADLLLVLLLLLYFRITLSDDFHQHTSSAILAGLTGGLAYLAKAYAFPFFLAHFTIIHFIIGREKINWKNFIAGLLAFMVISLPWTFALWWKYGEWLTSTSGKLNWSWYLKNPNEDYKGYFLQPPHAKASCAWEDPYFLQNEFYKPWHSFQLFMHQIRVLLFTFQQWLLLIFKQSFLVPGILTSLLIALFQKPTKQIKKTILFCLLLPAGYWLMHIEDRFIWATTLIVLAAGMHILIKIFQHYQLSERNKIFIWLLFFGSFVIEPINWLKDNRFRHRELFALVSEIKETGIKGSFTSNKKMDECAIIAYSNKLQFYTPAPKKIHLSKYVQEAKAAGIAHYLYFFTFSEEKAAFMALPEVKTARKIHQITNESLLVSF